MKCKNTQVFIRILPRINNCWKDIKILEDKKTIYVRSLQDLSKHRDEEANYSPSYWRFDTDGVFFNNSQLEIYEAVTKDILDRVILKGNNALILAYGQTGSGKSITISGLNAAFEDRGILPRLISDVFTHKERLKDTISIRVDLSYIETQRNCLRDLLVTSNVCLDYNTIKNVTSVRVTNEEDAMKLLFLAEGRRAVVSDIHRNSHISNTVCTLSIVGKFKRIQSKKIVSKIHVTDLVGADRYGFDTCFFKTAFDVGTGNLSKMQLGQFLIVLAENIPEKILVSQHLNILIYYLRDCLTNDNIIRFVGHIRSDREQLLITLSMLRFAQTFKGLKVRKLKKNLYDNEDVYVQKLEQDLSDFKKELDLNSMLHNESLKENITQERIDHIESVADDYLKNKANELNVLTVCDARVFMKVFKNIYNKLQIERDQLAGLAERLRKTADETTHHKVPNRRDSILSAKNVKRNANTKSATSYDSSSSKKTKGTKRLVPTSGVAHVEPKIDPILTDAPKASLNNSRSLRRSSSGRRRSSQLSEQQKSDTATPDTDQMPSAVPTHSEAWSSFMCSHPSMVAVCDEVQVYKQHAIDANKVYMEQVKLFTEYKNAVDVRQDDMLKARMQREIIQGLEDVPTLSALETKCGEILNDAKLLLLNQQEVVLKSQAELKLYIEQCNATKNELQAKFNTYCKDIYKTSVPAVPEPEENMDCDSKAEQVINADSLDNIEEMEIKLKTDADLLLIQFEELKYLRDQEYEKKCSSHLKDKKWVRSCKAT